MRKGAREEREAEIEAAAYRLLEERGFAGAGMQAIALAARASNETLYRWYGDKNGLFRVLITRNAELVRGALLAARADGARGVKTLTLVGPVLLAMLLGERAVALNRAAAADVTGLLGRTLAECGRNAVAPLIGEVMAEAQAAGELVRQDGQGPVSPRDLAELWLTTLIGDLQIRRATHAIPASSATEIAARNDRAIKVLRRIYAPQREHSL